MTITFRIFPYQRERFIASPSIKNYGFDYTIVNHIQERIWFFVFSGCIFGPLLDAAGSYKGRLFYVRKKR
jgi:hypothetical protein